MRKTHFTVSTILAAVAMSSTLVQSQEHPSTRPATHLADDSRSANAVSTDKVLLPPGVTEQPIGDRQDLTDLLGEATNAALTNGGFDDLIERFNDQDRNRLGKLGTTDNDQANATLNGRIDQIRKAFKDKYGSELDLDANSDKLFTDAKFVRGEVKDSSLLMANWPLPAAGRQHAKKADGSSGAVADSNAITPTETTPAEEANLENGREVAVGMLPARADAPIVRVSIVGEMTSWKLDIPNRMSVDQLRDNLLAHLTKCGEMADKWPADRNDAQASLARHVLLGIYGVPVQSETDSK